MIPEGYKQIEDAEVFVKDGELVICGTPDDEDEGHNCDYMGCSSVSHVLYRTTTEFTPDYLDLVQKCASIILNTSHRLPADCYVENLNEIIEELKNVLGID